jgi:hypothetical protein
VRVFDSLERPLLIGVVHLAATPGSPGYSGSMEPLLSRAAEDARALARGGCDALIVENFGDVPFHKRRVPAETIAALALAVERVREAAGALPLGINVLRNDARSALGLCAATGAAFIRVNVHTGAASCDQGLIEGDAARTLRERARLCPGVEILADVHVKHATPLGSETIAQAAEETLGRGLADALIVSGRATGAAPDSDDLARVREVVQALRAPLLIGSGLNAANAHELMRHADGAIVGTALKRDGRVEAPVELARVQTMRAALDA